MGNGANGAYKSSSINKGSGQSAVDYISVGISGVPIISFDLILSGSGKVYGGAGTGNVTVAPGIQLSFGRLVGEHTRENVDEFIFGGGAKIDSPRPLGVGYSAVFSGSKMANQINLGTPSWLPGGGGGYAAPLFDLAPDRPRGVPLPVQEQKVSNQYKPQGLIGSTETPFRPSYPSISAGSFIGRVYGKP
jgi:hypothetical protein